MLSYLCAGRAGAARRARSKISSRGSSSTKQAGLGVDPLDVAGFSAAALQLAESPDFREKAGHAARHYADTHFDIDRITDRFEQICGP